MRTAGLLLTLLVLGLCGCGGGDASNAANAPAYVPDLSTPAGATEAYAYAIENMDEAVATAVYATAEREDSLESFRQICKASLAESYTWKLTFENAAEIEGKGEAHVLVTFMPVHKKKGEQPEQGNRRWVVFVREADNNWRVSRKASDAVNEAAGWGKNGEKLVKNPPPPSNANPAANGG